MSDKSVQFRNYFLLKSTENKYNRERSHCAVMLQFSVSSILVKWNMCLVEFLAVDTISVVKLLVQMDGISSFIFL